MIISSSYTIKKICLEYSYFPGIREHLTLKFFQKCRNEGCIIVF